MTLITWAMLILAAFVAIWIFVVIPAEKRHHERKLEALRNRIEKRQVQSEADSKYAAPGDDNDD